MSTSPELAAKIDTCEYVFLRELSEPKENSLHLLVEEAKPSMVSAPIRWGRQNLATVAQSALPRNVVFSRSTGIQI